MDSKGPDQGLYYPHMPEHTFSLGEPPLSIFVKTAIDCRIKSQRQKAEYQLN